ncbi:OmpP1/FadL family transporter, partial [Thermodesulfobacteriota bacterium]
FFYFNLITLVVLFNIGNVFAQLAQEVDVSGSPNPVGSGARALGMGGAFISVADDATAASWNPGGLIQLELPEASIVISGEKLTEERAFRNNPGASGEYDVTLYDLNYFSLAYPFAWRERNFIVSLNYQTLYNFNKTHNYNYQFRHTSTSQIETSLKIIDRMTEHSGPRYTSHDTDGYLKAISPAFAVQITPYISMGFTINYFHPSLDSEWNTSRIDRFSGERTETITVSDIPPLPPNPVITETTYSSDLSTEYFDEYKFESSINPFDIFSKEVSYNIGFLWEKNKFKLGVVYKAPFKAKVKYKEMFGYSMYDVNIDDPTDLVASEIPLTLISDETQEMHMPASYGLGVAYRFSDFFLMALDIYRTDWQDFLLRQASGREISLITGQEISKSSTEPTHQIRIGAERWFKMQNKYIHLRSGFFIDPEPTKGDPDKFYGFSIGGGISTVKYSFDIAYQFRWGRDVRMVRLANEEIYQDVNQHTIYTSLIYYFE